MTIDQDRPDRADPTPGRPPVPRDRLLAPEFRATTFGTFALVSLGAFESLALTTVMPQIATDLQGESLYAMAFTATLAAGIVSIVLAGNLADRRGPRIPLLIGVLLFAAGLIGAALAPGMAFLVGARVLQGLGAGMTTTALYVLITRCYPPRMHTAVFAGFAAAWVVPSIVGPFLAGLIAQTLGWRWVFGVSLVVLVIASLLLSKVVGTLPDESSTVGWRWRALGASVVVAIGVLALNAVAERPRGLPLLVGAVAAVVLLIAVTVLTPRGSLRAARGLPADVALRALAFAGFTGAEIYIPRLLTERNHFEPTLAGLALSVAGVSWFLASAIQGRWSERIEPVRSARCAFALLTLALLAMVAVAALDGPAWLLIAVWPVAGFGMGTLYPRVSAEALSRAGDRDKGFVSAALQIGDSTGASMALAVSAIVFALVGAVSGVGGFGGSWFAYAAVFAVMVLPAAIGWSAAHRIADVTPARR